MPGDTAPCLPNGGRDFPANVVPDTAGSWRGEDLDLDLAVTEAAGHTHDSTRVLLDVKPQVHRYCRQRQGAAIESILCIRPLRYIEGAVDRSVPVPINPGLTFGVDRTDVGGNVVVAASGRALAEQSHRRVSVLDLVGRKVRRVCVDRLYVGGLCSDRRCTPESAGGPEPVLTARAAREMLHLGEGDRVDRL